MPEISDLVRARAEHHDEKNDRDQDFDNDGLARSEPGIQLAGHHTAKAGKRDFHDREAQQLKAMPAHDACGVDAFKNDQGVKAIGIERARHQKLQKISLPGQIGDQHEHVPEAEPSGPWQGFAGRRRVNREPQQHPQTGAGQRGYERPDQSLHLVARLRETEQRCVGYSKQMEMAGKRKSPQQERHDRDSYQICNAEAETRGTAYAPHADRRTEHRVVQDLRIDKQQIERHDDHDDGMDRQTAMVRFCPPQADQQRERRQDEDGDPGFSRSHPVESRAEKRHRHRADQACYEAVSGKHRLPNDRVSNHHLHDVRCKNVDLDQDEIRDARRFIADPGPRAER